MEIPRGEITKTVYTLIKEEKFTEAIEILGQLLDIQPTSRSALSLLGYCYFQIQSFNDAAGIYDRLANLYPDIPEYQFYLSQSLYNATAYEEALTASYLRGDPDKDLQEKVMKLQAAVQYCTNETADAKSLIDKCSESDPDIKISSGCLEYKEGNYLLATQHFEEASDILGMNPLLWYNRAVTYYQMGDLPSAAHFIGEIIEQGVMIHPELGVGFKLEDKDSMASVGNSRILHKTALIEALNLKAAIEFDLDKSKAALETIRDLPTRTQEEVDPITLHNLAILNLQAQPMESLRKLRYLIDQEQGSFPPEVFQNLLILYCRYEQYDLIADLMAIYDEYKMKFLCPNMRNFFEALIKRETAPDEAVKLLEELCTTLSDSLRKLVKQVEDVKVSGSDEEAKKICNEFDEIIEGAYTPALMAMGKIFWDKENFIQVEKTLRQGAEFLDDRDCWLSNVAHVVFRRGEDYDDAAGLYELVVRKYQTRLLEVSAISLANLCVSYIIMSRIEEAERMIKNIELQEAELIEKYPGVKVFHSCIMNMVIGTLYCVKKNYNFGISRIMKSLDDYKIKLGPDTWFYAKRCILSMLEKLVKNSISMQDNILYECIEFLVQCEDFGRDVSTVIEEKNCLSSADESIPIHYGTRTVTYEARYLRLLLSRALEWGLT